MRRLFKWFGISMGVLIGLLLLAIVLLPLLFDPNDHKDRIQAMVTDATGRPFEINGPIEWSLFPWVGFAATDVVLGNDPAFQAPNMARIGRVATRVKLLPLITGDIEVGAVTLSELALNLEIDASGRDNWSSLLAANEGQTPAGEDSTSGGLSIASVAVSDSEIHFIDRASDSDVRLIGLNLATGAIAPAMPMAFDLDFKAEALGFTGGLALEGTITDLFEGTPMIVLEQFDVQGRLLEPALDIVLSLGDSLQLDLGVGSLVAPDIFIETHGARVEISATLEGLFEEFAARGNLELIPFNPRALVTAIDPSLTQGVDSQAFKTLSASAAWQLGKDSVDLDVLRVELDDTVLTGSLQLTSIDALAGAFELSIDQLNVDRYLATEAALPVAVETGEPVTSTAAMALGHLRGTLAIDTLQVGGMALSGVRLSVQTDGEKLRIYPMTAQFYDGELNAEIALLGNNVRLKSSVSSFQVEPALRDVAGEPYLAGTGDLSIDASIADYTSDALLSTLDGQVRFDFRDGAVYGVNIIAMLRQALVLLGKAPDNNGEAGESSTDFSSFELAGTLEQGILSTETLKLMSPYLRVAGDGWVNLAAMTLDMRISPVLVDTPEGQDSTLQELEGITVPVRLTGALDAPEVAIDPAKLLLATQKKRLDGTKGELLKGLLDPEGEGSEQDPAALLLKGLLEQRGKKKKEREHGSG